MPNAHSDLIHEDIKNKMQDYSLQNMITIENQNVFLKSAEKMDEIPNNYTSPPYNRGKKYSSDSDNSYNDNLPEEDYLAFLERVWKECYRVSNEKCILFLNIGDSAKDQGISEKVANSVLKAGWTRIQDIVWVKSIYGQGHYTPSGGNKRFNNIWEHIFLFVKNKQKYELNPKAIGIPYADKSNIGRYGKEDLRDPGNVLHICYEKTTGASIKKGHDAPFPIGLPYKCIKSVPNAQYILDPFLGTGTTLAAAAYLELKGYGYEKYPRVDLIQETIILGKNFLPKTPILIPHYKESIKTLIEFLLDSKYQISPPKSKKSLLKYQILIDTLEKMGINSDFLHNLHHSIQESKSP